MPHDLSLQTVAVTVGRTTRDTTSFVIALCVYQVDWKMEVCRTGFNRMQYTAQEQSQLKRSAPL